MGGVGDACFSTFREVVPSNPDSERTGRSSSGGLWLACLQRSARYLFIIWRSCVLFAASVQETINWIPPPLFFWL